MKEHSVSVRGEDQHAEKRGYSCRSTQTAREGVAQNRRDPENVAESGAYAQNHVDREKPGWRVADEVCEQRVVLLDELLHFGDAEAGKGADAGVRVVVELAEALALLAQGGADAAGVGAVRRPLEGHRDCDVECHEEENREEGEAVREVQQGVDEGCHWEENADNDGIQCRIQKYRL